MKKKNRPSVRVCVLTAKLFLSDGDHLTFFFFSFSTKFFDRIAVTEMRAHQSLSTEERQK
jgi:hypothetical protein